MAKEYIFKLDNALYNEETGEAVFKPKVVCELVRCKDCKYRPHWDESTNPKERSGFDLEFPDYKEGNRCPCRCVDDPWYSFMPEDDFFCADGDRKEQEDDERKSN